MFGRTMTTAGQTDRRGLHTTTDGRTDRQKHCPLPLARPMYCLLVNDFAMGGQLDGLLPFLVALL